MALGSIFGFGAILGGKLAPSWHQVGTKIQKMRVPRRCQKREVKKSCSQREGPRVAAGEMGFGPLKTIKNTFENVEKYKNRNARPSAGAVADNNN